MKSFQRTYRASSRLSKEQGSAPGLTASSAGAALLRHLEVHPTEVPVSREIMEDLDRRMDHFRQHPDAYTSWQAVKERTLA